MHRNTTDELDDYGNLQMTSKTTQENSNIILQRICKKTERKSKESDSEISGIDKNNVTEDRIDTKGIRCLKERKRENKAFRQSMQG